MYPNLQYFIEKTFSIHAGAWTAYINTFGCFVALAFLLAAWILTKELKRKEMMELLHPESLSLEKGKRFLSKRARRNYTSATVEVFPHQRVAEIVPFALIAGLIGAKIFNALETWDQFKADPIASLISGGGLTFYGGFTAAAVTIFYYCKKHKINFIYFCDAISPALMLAYGIGRLGCHFSGDGDWGVFNSAYISLPDASVRQATPPQFNSIMQEASGYFVSNFGQVNNVPHISVLSPKGLPSWSVAMSFPHNVLNEGVLIENCSGKYCHMLPVPVFPTSLYEAIICVLLFGLLWLARKKFKYAWHLFGLYLLLNGTERFFIEKIKVNYKYDWGFIHPAQSEIISFILAIVGILILLTYRNRRFAY